MNKQRHSEFPFVRGALALAMAVISSPGMAQTRMLEEVIVTAQKREQTVQDVPSSVAAFSSEMLSQSNTQNFDQLSNIASGINITASPDGFGSVIRIRGVGTNAFVPAIRPSVGIFLDDIPLGSSAAAYSNMADIERVEILKGPQATLFGKEVSSGAISLFTRRPDTQAMDGYVEGNFGNLGLQEFRVGGNIPIAETAAIRASVYSNDRDGTVRNVFRNFDEGEQDSQGYRLRGLWEPTDTFSLTLGYEDHESESYGDPSVAVEYGDLFFKWEESVEGVTDPADSKLVPFDLADRKTSSYESINRKTDTSILSVHLDWQLSDAWTMSSITSDQEYSLDMTGTGNNGFVNSDGVQVPSSGGIGIGPYPITNVIQFTGTDTQTQELRFTYEADNWSSIIGAFYAQTDQFTQVHFNQLALQLGALSIFAPGLTDLTEDSTEWALFTHNIFSIREGLDLTFGLRYSDITKESHKGQLVGDWGYFKDNASEFIPSTPWGDDIPKQDDSWDEVTGTVKLTWWVSDEISVYGGWDRGFKAGGHNVCKGTDDIPDCSDPFSSETADNFEVGLKGRFLENTLVLNTAAYYQTYDDYQVSIQDDVGPGASVRNAAKAEIQGVEADFQWLATPNLLVDGNVAYVDARWDDYANAGCLRPQYSEVACSPDENGVPVQDLSGRRLNFTSPWSALTA
jgi:iron complex outermembrane receptor protein